MNNFFYQLDEFLYKILLKYRDNMPQRLIKFIANFYTDARVRVFYWEKLGIRFSDGSFPNLGLKLVPNSNDICVHIGNNVSLAPNITFVCHSSANNGVEINTYPYVQSITKEADITVEDDAWIGANVTILPGVTVGRCSVIGAGSVVLNNIDPYGVYVGVPARKIKDIRECQQDR